MPMRGFKVVSMIGARALSLPQGLRFGGEGLWGLKFYVFRGLGVDFEGLGVRAAPSLHGAREGTKPL